MSLLMKNAYGIGLYISKIRGKGEKIKSTNGNSTGIS